MTDTPIISDIEERIPETSTKRKVNLEKERIPIYKQQALVYSTQEPGWKYRMVNDTPGRIQKFLRAGWELVKGNVADTYSGTGRKEETSASGSHISRIVDPDNIYKDGYLMRIPMEKWLADQKAKEDILQKNEEELVDGEGRLTVARKLGPLANVK